MKRFLTSAVLVIIAAAYLVGYWPEYQRRLAVENEVSALRFQISEAEGRVRTARLLGELLNVIDAVASMNYGQAQTLLSTFFDKVRAEATRSPVAELQVALEAVLRNRDVVTSALARGDQGVPETLRKMQAQLREALRKMQAQLREALGYPVPPGAPAAATGPAPLANESARKEQGVTPSTPSDARRPETAPTR